MPHTPSQPDPPDIATQQRRAGAEFIPFGPLDTDADAGAGAPAAHQRPPEAQAAAPSPSAGGAASGGYLVASYGAYEAEYAVIRKGAGIFHQPHRAMLRIEGADRIDFLQRMLTQDVAALKPGQAQRSFLLGSRGRIAADMLILHEADRTFLELDRPDVADVAAQLESYVFTEDVSIHDESDALDSIAIHGPAAARLIDIALGAGVADLENLQHRVLGPGEHEAGGAGGMEYGGGSLRVLRHDQTGALGLHLWVDAAAAGRLYATLAEAVGGLVPEIDQSQVRQGGEPAAPQRAVVGRGIGWLAFNTARIEARRPLYHIDFGPDSLPHETGLLAQTVSFTKGCYLGQEIVARMQHLGHPAKCLVMLHLPDDRLPLAGEQIFTPPGSAPAPGSAPGSASGSAPPGLPPHGQAEPASGQDQSAGVDLRPGAVVGAITSSTLAPLRGHTALALAMVKWSHHEPGTTVLVPAEGAMVPATVQPLA